MTETTLTTLECKICTETVDELEACQPCSCSCACRACLRRWFYINEQAGAPTPSCPICRTAVATDFVEQILERPYEYHKSESAVERLADNTSEEMDEFTRTYLDQVEAKQCANCGFWIEREDGCEAMQCLCGYRFCWICSDLVDCECGLGSDDFYDNIMRTERDIPDWIDQVATADELQSLKTFIESKRVNT